MPVNPVPNPKDPLAGITGFPPLGAFTLASPARNLVALADGRIFFGEGSLNIFDAGNSRALQPMNFPESAQKGIRFAVAPDGKKVFVAIPDKAKIAGFRINGEQVGLLKPAGEVSTMAISPDGSTLVTGTFGGEVRIWNLATLVGSAGMPASHGPRPVELAAFSRDGSLVATASEKSIIVWNVREKKLVGAFANGHQATSMAFTPDGQKLLVASPAGLQTTPVNRNAWSTVKTRRPGILRVAFTNATNLAVLRGDELELYEWPTMTLLRQSPINSGDADTLAATPDGRILFVGLTSTRLLAFGTENDVVMKGYGSDGNERPVTPPPTGSNPYVGAWQHISVPTGSTKVKVIVQKAGNNLSAILEIDRTGTLCRAHVDSLRNINGKLRGNVIPDTAFPFPWTNLRELSLDSPNGSSMHVELRGDTQNPYTLRRQGGDFAPPPPPPPPPPPTPPAPVAKVAPPSEEKIKEVTATIRDTYKENYAKKSPAERAEFAETLLKLANESKNDPADRYVLCCEARDLAAAAGKWDIVSDAFEQLEAGFKVDLLPQKEAALQLLISNKGLTKESAIEASEAALQGIGEAIATDQLTLAGSFVAVASNASAKSPNVPLILLVKKADAELKLVAQEADAVKKARETLKSMPNDPAANLAVGRYEALRRGEWESALPLLAKGGDGELPAVARKDLEAPKDGAGQQKIAEEWWTLAEKEKESTWIRAALQGRAGHWYRQAQTQVTGLSGALITERLKTIDEAPSPFHSGGGASTELKSMRGHKSAVTYLSLTFDGKVLFSASLDSTVRRWDLKLAKNLSTFPAGRPLYGLAFSPSGQNIALEFKDSVKAIDAANPASTKRLPSGNGNALPGAYWVDEERLAWVGPNTYTSAGGIFGGSTFQHNMRISAIQASPNHQQVLTIGEETWLCSTFEDGKLSGQRFRTPLNDSTCAAFSPTRPLVAVATADKKIGIYDTQSRVVTTTLDGAGSVTRCLAYVPGGDRLLSGGDDGVVHIWDVNAGKEVRHFATGSKGVSSILVTPDGKQIITGGSDGVIRVWAMPREKGMKTAASGSAAPEMAACRRFRPPVASDSRDPAEVAADLGADVDVLVSSIANRVVADVRTVERNLDVDLRVFDPGQASCCRHDRRTRLPCRFQCSGRTDVSLRRGQPRSRHRQFRRLLHRSVTFQSRGP